MHRKPKELAEDHITATALGWESDPGPRPPEQTPIFLRGVAPASEGVSADPRSLSKSQPAPDPASIQAPSGTVHNQEAPLACED